MNELKYNYFDLEQRILDCWKITDEMELLSSTVLNNGLSDDSITNVLNGLHTLYELKFNRLWECYDEVQMGLVRKNKMLEEECKALREQLEFETKGNYGSGGMPTNQGAGRSSLFGVETNNFKPVPIIKRKKK